jgi:phosphoribosyl-ATP pyrophosphohydrolase
VGNGGRRFGDPFMKTFETLFDELKDKARRADPESGTVKLLAKGKHAIGKKLVEEAGESWMAAQYEGREKTAEELSQLLYHAQVMMIANELELEDVYRYL